MINLWNDIDEQKYLSLYTQHSDDYHGYINTDTDKDILLQAYATTLLGADNDLTMHGGGNTSVKTFFVDSAGTAKRALYVKASGTPLDLFTPKDFVVMDLNFLEGLKFRSGIDDVTMAREFKAHTLSAADKLPSIESLMHAFIPAKIVSHTHPAALLKIVNRVDGRELFKKCFGDDLAVVPYARMGYDLAKAVSEAARENAGRGCGGVVMRHHGLIVWGDDPKVVYDRTIDIVTKAEEFLASILTRPIAPPNSDGNISLALLSAPDVLELINSPDGKSIVCDPPLTPDYPMYSRISLRWFDGDIDAMPVPASNEFPIAVVNPKIGVMCYATDDVAAKRTADFVRQALSIRRAIFETGGTYESLADEFIADMQYRGYQQS